MDRAVIELAEPVFSTCNQMPRRITSPRRDSPAALLTPLWHPQTGVQRSETHKEAEHCDLVNYLLHGVIPQREYGSYAADYRRLTASGLIRRTVHPENNRSSTEHRRESQRDEYERSQLAPRAGQSRPVVRAPAAAIQSEPPRIVSCGWKKKECSILGAAFATYLCDTAIPSAATLPIPSGSSTAKGRRKGFDFTNDSVTPYPWPLRGMFPVVLAATRELRIHQLGMCRIA